MKNLEIILGKLEKKLDRKTSSFERKEKDLDKKYSKKIKDLIKKRTSEREKLHNEKTTVIEDLKKDSYSGAVEALIQDLKDDYRCLQKKCTYKNISQKEIDHAVEIKKVLSKLKMPEERETILKGLKTETRKLIEYEELDSFLTKKEINTYVTSKGDKCYVLAPVIEDKDNGLVKELVDKLLGVVGLGKISEDVGKTFKFQEDEIEYPQKFLMLGITSYSGDAKDLAKALIRKLNDSEIQPKGFKERNLVHKAISLDYNILKSFKEYGLKGIQKKEIQEAKDKPQEIKKSFKISKKYQDPDAVLDAYSKLREEYKEEYGKEIGISEITKQRIDGILGWDLYYALKGHVEKGFISLEKVPKGSSLENYVKKHKKK